jgi:F-type H+-transporting ATPase subunit c
MADVATTAQAVQATQSVMLMSAQDISAAIAMTFGPMGAAIGIGLVGGRAAEAIGRNPEAASKIQTAMILMAAFAEAIAIYCLVVALILKFV